ncbi:hypothetical protein ABH546_25030 [Escherichia coli]
MPVDGYVSGHPSWLLKRLQKAMYHEKQELGQSMASKPVASVRQCGRALISNASFPSTIDCAVTLSWICPSGMRGCLALRMTLMLYGWNRLHLCTRLPGFERRTGCDRSGCTSTSVA